MENEVSSPQATEQPLVTSVRPAKQFKQYFFEGLMIFIAVSFGFMADNLRDTINDRELERGYMKSMIEDLKNDTSALSLEVMKSKRVTQKIDSLTDMLMNAKKGDNAIEAYIMMRESFIYLRKIPIFTRRTFDQMQSAGLLRLIADREVSEAISNYYQGIVTFEWTDDLYKNGNVLKNSW
jgi:hypothetical protein